VNRLALAIEVLRRTVTSIVASYACLATSDDIEHPFSLHQLALLGVDYGKAIGDWFGPASTAAVLRLV
jgi:hypothetical protein